MGEKPPLACRWTIRKSALERFVQWCQDEDSMSERIF
jgi:hypothetical protein